MFKSKVQRVSIGPCLPPPPSHQHALPGWSAYYNWQAYLQRHNYHPEFTVCIRVDTLCCVFCGLGEMACVHCCVTTLGTFKMLKFPCYFYSALQHLPTDLQFIKPCVLRLLPNLYSVFELRTSKHCWNVDEIFL